MVSADQKPTIRILHHMARSGGTILSRCLGSMRGVTLLSEVSPVPYRAITPATMVMCAQFHPILQAYKWHGLFSVEEAEMLSIQTSLDYATLIQLVQRRCEERGETLLLRDWSHADFTTHPPFPEPSYQHSIVEALRDHFTISNTYSVRHPIDQWLSLRRLVVIQGNVSLEKFLYGYRLFAEHCAAAEFVRYEDFVDSPETELQNVCRRLDLRYDPEFKVNWMNYSKVTGDLNQNRAETAIEKLPRREFEPDLLRQVEGNEDYRIALELLGYVHPEGTVAASRSELAAPNFLNRSKTPFDPAALFFQQDESQP